MNFRQNPSLAAAVELIEAGADPRNPAHMRAVLAHLMAFGRSPQSCRTGFDTPQGPALELALAAGAVSTDIPTDLQIDLPVDALLDIVKAGELRQYLCWETVEALKLMTAQHLVRHELLVNIDSGHLRKPRVALSAELVNRALVIGWQPRVGRQGAVDFEVGQMEHACLELAVIEADEFDAAPGKREDLGACPVGVAALCAALEGSLQLLVEALAVVVDVELGYWPSYSSEGVLEVIDADERVFDFLTRALPTAGRVPAKEGSLSVADWFVVLREHIAASWMLAPVNQA